MPKKNFVNDLFKCLDWIFKKDLKDIQTLQLPSSFIINRWVSMVDASIAFLVNETTNKWINSVEVCKNPQSLSRLYRVLMPRYCGHIRYLKKKQKNEKQSEFFQIAPQMEISQREINLYDKTLEEINNLIK